MQRRSFLAAVAAFVVAPAAALRGKPSGPDHWVELGPLVGASDIQWPKLTGAMLPLGDGRWYFHSNYGVLKHDQIMKDAD